MHADRSALPLEARNLSTATRRPGWCSVPPPDDTKGDAYALREPPCPYGSSFPQKCWF